jgi:hypothetical protein
MQQQQDDDDGIAITIHPCHGKCESERWWDVVHLTSYGRMTRLYLFPYASWMEYYQSKTTFFPILSLAAATAAVSQSIIIRDQQRKDCFVI